MESQEIPQKRISLLNTPKITIDENYLTSEEKDPDTAFKTIKMSYQAKSKKMEDFNVVFDSIKLPKEEHFPKHEGTDYKFLDDYFTYNYAWLQKFCEEAGFMNSKEKLKVLEIGTYEGKCSAWLLENLTENKDSRIYLSDFFHTNFVNPNLKKAYKENYEERFLHNVKATGKEDQAVVLKGSSFSTIPSLYLEHKSSFDLVIVDGSHRTFDVLTDGCNAFRLVKIGGYIMFDDYSQDKVEELPGLAVDCFLACVNYMKERAVVKRKSWQCCVQKIAE